MDRHGAASALAGTLILVTLALSASIAPFQEPLSNILSSGFIEEYSYIMIILIEVVFLAAYLVPRLEPRTRLGPAVVLSSLFYSLGAAIFAVLSRISSDYSFQFAGVSLALIIIGSTVAVLSPRGVRGAAPLIAAALMLIPFPRSTIESLAVRLSPTVGYLAALLTGSDLVRVGNRVFIDYGGGSFEIVYACSGVVSLTGVMALLPLVLYVTRGSPAKRRIMAVSASLAAGALIVYLGNLLRIVLIVEAAKRYGSEAGLAVFHSTPSIVYVAVASALAIWLSARISGQGGEPSRQYPHGSAARVFAAGVIFLLALGVAGYVAHDTVSTTRVGYLSPSYVEERIVEIVLPYEGVKYRELESLRQFLGASKVYAFYLDFNGSVYRGYVEVAKSVGSFHDWTICLEYQGFIVENKWVQKSGNTTITFYRYHAPSGPERILAVSLYAIDLGASTPYYVRVSVFPRSMEDAQIFFTHILQIPSVGSQAASQNLGLLVDVFSAVTAISLAYYTLLLVGRLLSIAVKKTVRSGLL